MDSIIVWIDFSASNTNIDFRPKLMKAGVLEVVAANLTSTDTDVQVKL